MLGCRNERPKSRGPSLVVHRATLAHFAVWAMEGMRSIGGLQGLWGYPPVGGDREGLHGAPAHAARAEPERWGEGADCGADPGRGPGPPPPSSCAQDCGLPGAFLRGGAQTSTRCPMGLGCPQRSPSLPRSPEPHPFTSSSSAVASLPIHPHVQQFPLQQSCGLKRL